MKRTGLIVLAFVVMLGIALAMMVDFTGPQPVATETARPDPVPPPAKSGLVVPVAGVAPTAIADSWGDPREDGARAHAGTDIMAPEGTPVVAADDGVVEKLFDSAAGGIALYHRSLNRRLTYYYAHLRGYAPGVVEGMRIRRGQIIGYVGDTGNAGVGNFHLHFGIARMGQGDRWWQGQPVNPYPLLARQR